MRKAIALLCIALIIAFSGCISEKTKPQVKVNVTPTTTAATVSYSKPTQIPINESDINQLMNYMEQIENISFNI